MLNQLKISDMMKHPDLTLDNIKNILGYYDQNNNSMTEESILDLKKFVDHQIQQSIKNQRD